MRRLTVASPADAGLLAAVRALLDYERLGWRRWRGPTFVRHGAGLIRTPDDDGGLMVLLAGVSEGLDLTVPIVCEARPGDPW